MKRFYLLFFFFTVFNYAFAQKDTSSLRSIEEECIEIDTNDDDYIIRLGVVNYNDNEKAFVCADFSLINIEVVYRMSGESVVGQYWDWNECECSPISPLGSSAIIHPIDFDGDEKLTVKVSFDDLNDTTDDLIKLKLKLRLSNIQNKFDEFELINHTKTHEFAIRGYDENNYAAYPGGEIDVRYKFLLKDEFDKVHFKINKQILKGLDLNSSPLNDMTYQKSNEVLDSKFTADIVGDENTMRLTNCCQIPIIENHIFKDVLEADIYVWKVRESDDDIMTYDINNPSFKKDGTPITSPNFVCINPGDDKTLDLYRFTLDGQLQPQDWLDFNNDDINFEFTSQMEVLAGNDLTCQSTSYGYYKTGNENINISDDFEVNYMLIEERLNSVYKQVGIKFNIIDKGELNANFDYIYEDEELEKLESNFVLTSLSDETEEVRSGHKIFLFKKLYDQPAPPGSESTIQYGFSNLASSFIDYKRRQSNTIAHEIGHSVFELSHSDEEGNTEGVNVPVLSDIENLMISGSRSSGSFSKQIIRKYTWEKIRLKLN